MQSTNSEYGSPYLAVCHCHFHLITLEIYYFEKNDTNFFKVSGCKQFILATFKYKKKYLKCVYLNVAKINWLQPLYLKKISKFNESFFSVYFLTFTQVKAIQRFTWVQESTTFLMFLSIKGKTNNNFYLWNVVQ